MAISGSGNVAIYAAYKCLELGAKVITLSDSGGYHIVEDGMTKEMIDAIDDIKVAKKGRLHEYKNDKGELPYNISSCSGCFTRKYLTSQLHTALFLFQSASAHAAPHLDSPFFFCIACLHQ